MNACWTCSNAHRRCSNKMRRTARCRGAAASWRTSEGLGGFGYLAAVVSAATPASSQSPRVDTQISPRKVEVGERFIVQATISTEPGTAPPTNPTLLVPPGVTASAPNISTQQQVTISGGRIHQSNGVTATWGLSAARPGTYRIGPPSFQVGPTRVQGRAANVEVVAAGAGPRQQRPGWTDPFDLFSQSRFSFVSGLRARSTRRSESRSSSALSRKSCGWSAQPIRSHF